MNYTQFNIYFINALLKWIEFLTCLYSSSVIVPSLSVSCMLNRTTVGRKRKYIASLVLWIHGLVHWYISPRILLSRECFEYCFCMFLQRNLALLISSLCSSVIWWVGALKNDITVRNSSKPISSTDPTLSFLKFLLRTSKYSRHEVEKKFLSHKSHVPKWCKPYIEKKQPHSAKRLPFTIKV